MVVYDTSKQNKTINIYIQNRTYMTSGWQKMKIFNLPERQNLSLYLIDHLFNNSNSYQF